MTMTALNSLGSGFGVSRDQELHNVQHSQQQGAVNEQSDKRGLESVRAVGELEHTETNHDNDVFSSNRQVAFQAYINYNGQDHGTGSTTKAQSEPQLPFASQEEDEAVFNPLGDDEDEEEADNPLKAAGEEDEDKPKLGEKSVKGADGQELTDEEKQKLEELQDRDEEVRVHEQAHQSRGGALASSPSYEYEKGPDGKNYAVGGHVNIDISEEDDPQKTITKMQTVKAAALAPQEPSSQDRKVAAEAQQKENAARAELAEQRREGTDTGDVHSNGVSGSNDQDKQDVTPDPGSASTSDSLSE